MYQIVEFWLRTTNETQLKSILPGWILILLSLHLIKFDIMVTYLEKRSKVLLATLNIKTKIITKNLRSQSE